jgi:hypothetical protein
LILNFHFAEDGHGTVCKGAKIFLNEDLKVVQVDQCKKEMAHLHEVRREGNKQGT